jgi:hypothetical protein
MSRPETRPSTTDAYHMKMLLPMLILGTLIATSASAQSENGEQSSERLDARSRMIQECMAMNKRYNTAASGGFEFMYHACMANHRQPG